MACTYMGIRKQQDCFCIQILKCLISSRVFSPLFGDRTLIKAFKILMKGSSQHIKGCVVEKWRPYESFDKNKTSKRDPLRVLTTNKPSCLDTKRILGNNEQNKTTDKEMPAFTSFVSFEQVVQILWPRKEMVGYPKRSRVWPAFK